MKKRKYSLLLIAAICLIFQVSCSGKETLQEAGELTFILKVGNSKNRFIDLVVESKPRDFPENKERPEDPISQWAAAKVCRARCGSPAPSLLFFYESRIFWG